MVLPRKCPGHSKHPLPTTQEKTLRMDITRWSTPKSDWLYTHSSTLAWKIPRTEELGRLQSMGSLRIRHDWVTSLSLFTFMHWRRNGNPLQCSCLEDPRDGGAWWAAVYGVTQSRKWLKRVSSSSSSSNFPLWFAFYVWGPISVLYTSSFVSFKIPHRVQFSHSVLSNSLRPGLTFIF